MATALGQLGVYLRWINVNQIIARPYGHVLRIIGGCDVIIKLDGTPDKSKWGANATRGSRRGVLKAAAASLDFRCISISRRTCCVLTDAGRADLFGSRKYGGGERSGVKPSTQPSAWGSILFRSFVCGLAYQRRVSQHDPRSVHVDSRPGHISLSRRACQDDRELWDFI